jgi:hypothetical protein
MPAPIALECRTNTGAHDDETLHVETAPASGKPLLAIRRADGKPPLAIRRADGKHESIVVLDDREARMLLTWLLTYFHGA